MPSPVQYATFTASDIITRALELANNPDIVSEAQDYLNLVIDRLYRRFNFEFALKLYTFNAQTTAPLPSDFLRIADLTYTYNQEIFTVEKLHLTTFDEIPIKNLITSPIPFDVSVDALNGTIVIFPTLTTPLPFSLRYYMQAPVITDFTGYPPFPDSDLLIRMVTGWAMMYMDDDRTTDWVLYTETKLQEMLRNIETMPDIPYRIKLGWQYRSGPIKKSKITGGF